MSNQNKMTDITLLATAQEERRLDAEKLLLMQDVDGDMGKGVIALLAMFLGFMHDPSGGSLSDNKAVMGLFKSVGFSEKDITHANETGQLLKSGEITAVEATKSLFDRIKEPETTLSTSEAKAAVQNIAPNIPKVGNFTLNDRQEAIVATIPLAAETAGIHPNIMKAMWGVESGFGTLLNSPTGCEGDWQFSQATWDTIMKRYGDDIAEAIKENFPERAAELTANYKTAGSINEYQHDPIVSTYAAAFLMQDNAGYLKIDPSKEENGRCLYMAHNVGGPKAKTVNNMFENGDTRSVESVIGDAATKNPLFYSGGANARLAITRYDSGLLQRRVEYNQKFSQLEIELAAKAKAASADSETQVAQNDAEKDQSTQQGLTSVYNDNNSNGGTKVEDPAEPVILTAEFKKIKHTTEEIEQEAIAIAAAETKQEEPKPEDGQEQEPCDCEPPSKPLYASTETPGMGGAV